MKAQFIYSVAALATFPIVVNAQVNAEDTGAITIKKNETSWTKTSKELAKGKYSFLGGINAFGKDAVLKIEATGVDVTKTLKKDEAITADFELADASTVKITVTAAAAMAADASVAESKIQLNFDFTKVAQLLFIEYNKVTTALSAAEYPGKTAAAAKFSAYYDRIMAIQGADYAYYVSETEGLKGISSGEQGEADVKTLGLYTKIQEALQEVQNDERDYQVEQLNGGTGGLTDLNTRYTKLGADYGVNYITTALTTKKNAAENARDAYNTDPTAEKLQAAKDARTAYKNEVVKEEGVAAKNETAKANLDAALKAVYDPSGLTGYYKESLTQIDAQYEGTRYQKLKAELLMALYAYVSGSNSAYETVAAAIQASYANKKADADQTDLGVDILQFKQKLTVTISDYKAQKDILAAAYAAYDSEKEAADKLVKDATDFLVQYKTKVDNAVATFLEFIEANDVYAKIANLTDAAIQEKKEAITAAKAEYTTQAGIYADYKALKAAVEGKTTALNTVKTAIDADAKTDKKLAEEDFKPTTLWKSTIEGIEENIGKLAGYVYDNRTNATVYKTKQTYIDSLQAIQISIDKLNTEALQATALYAGYAAKLKVAKDSLIVMNDKDKAPLVDFTALRVWSNQVTIDADAKKRTPYKNFLDDQNGSIAAANNDLVGILTVMGTTGPLSKVTGTILEYLKSEPVTKAVKAVTDGSALMTEILANYQADEKLFEKQIDIQICNGLIVQINAKAAEFEPIIAALQKNIKDGKYGNVKGALLKAELDGITAKIDAAKAVAAKEGATKDELTDAYNSIKSLNDTGKEIKTAEAHALEYAQAFEHFEDNYADVVGTDNDDATVSTIAGLLKKVAAQKAVVDGLAELTATQKTALKNKVQTVSVEKEEGTATPKVKVTYSISAFESILATAKANEKLTDDTVTYYKGIIEELKAATDPIITQATNLNSLEGKLNGIDFAAAKAAVKAQDPNTDGFFYQLLIGNTKAGQCTFDFNTLKKKIEDDDAISATEYTTYDGEITTLKNTIAGLPQKAKDNLKAFTDAKEHYNNVPTAGSPNKGAVQRYDEAWEKLLKCPSSKLEEQKTVITGMKTALDQLRTDAELSYNNGKAKEDGYAAKIDSKIEDIEAKVNEYTNPSNYNAQVALDNKAMKDAIQAAHEAADAAYAKASAAVNTCKNFKSTELKDATEAAAAELQALLDYLVDYNDKVEDIQGKANNEYSETISPAFFDKDGKYKKQFEDIKGEIEALTNALSEKVREAAAVKVTASINSYSGAIAFSKAKIAKFSSGNDLTEAQVAALFTVIDGMQKAIVDNNVENADITALDKALAKAEGDDGITASIAKAEQDQAQKALKELIDKNTHSDLLTGQDKGKFESIVAKANSTDDADRKACVSNFATYKSDLNNLKTKADQLAAEKAAKEAAETAIDNANGALTALTACYQLYAAGYQVKADVEQIAEDLKAYDKSKITASNAAAWKTAVEAISARIEAVYVALYDFEVPVLEGLIATAKEELLTYSKDDKADITANVTAEENNLKAVKEAVAKPSTASGYKTKKNALIDLKSIETNLNTEIKKLTDGNQTNINATIVAGLEAQIEVVEGRIVDALKNLNVGLSGNQRHFYLDVKNVKQYYATTSAITAEKTAIENSIDDLDDYITDNADQIVAYEANAKAMLEDIKAAVTTLERNVSLEVEKQLTKFIADDNKTIKKAKDDAQAKVTAAKNQIDRLVAQLGFYESTSKYANKINYMNAQLAEASGIMDDAIAEAGEATTLRAEYLAYADALTPINNALVGVQANCEEIEAQAKADYIAAFIANLDAQIIADSWTGSANYTNTDQGVLTDKRNALKTYVNGTLKNNATGRPQAEDTRNGNLVVKGVITTLNEGAEKFADMLDDLVQAVKDLSLAEDVKGHITGGDEIGADDVQALINIIINGQEGEQDLEVCDINGDGRITVTDIIWLQFFDIFHEWPNMAATARGGYEMSDAVKMEVVSTRGNITRLAINLSNNDSYRAFQIGMQLPAGAKVVGQSLGDRVENAYLMHSQATEGNVRFMTIAFNSEFAGNEGAVLYVDVENLNGDVALTEAYFTNVELNEADLLSSGQTTSIRESITNALESAGQKIYNMGGRVMNGLKKGINIIRRNDGSNEKVIVK